MKLESKRHITKFYLIVTFMFLFCNAIGTLLISMFFDKEERAKGDTIYLLFTVGVLFVAFAFYTIYQ